MARGSGRNRLKRVRWRGARLAIAVAIALPTLTLAAAVAAAGADALGVKRPWAGAVDLTAAPACTKSWDGPATGSWSVAANWTDDTLPGVADHVCIGPAFTVTHSSGDDSVLSVQVEGALALSGGTLTLTDTANESTSTTFTHTTGTLDGPATLAVTGSYDWASGAQQGSGVTRIAAGATFTKSGGGGANLIERTLRVEGTARLTGTLGISTFQGATIETTAGGVFDFQSDADLPAVPGDPAERFLNAGTLTKSAGATQSFIGLELVNSATVSVSSGVLQLSGGDGAGEQGGSFGGTAQVEFTGGSWDLGAGTSFDGPVELGSATLALSSGATVPISTGSTFTQTSGIVEGAGTLLVNGDYDWASGAQQGSGVTRIAAGATFTKSGGGGANLIERTLRVEGTARLTGTLGISTFQGATIETTAGGVFDFQSDADLPAVPGDPAERFLNAGTLTKSAGATQSFIGLELVNSATVSVSSGVLQLSGGDGAGEQGGSFGGTAQVEFTGGSWDLGAGTSFDGPVELGSATLALSSGATVPISTGSTFTQTSGIVEGAGTLLVNGDYDWASGAQQGSGVTRIAAGATFTKSGGGGANLIERTLRVEGTARLTGTLGISTFQGATIETTAGGVFDFQSDADLLAVPGDPAERFLNAGTLTKSAGATQSFIGLELVNSATVSVSSGVLQLSGGDGAGEQGGSFGGTVRRSGVHRWGLGSRRRARVLTAGRARLGDAGVGERCHSARLDRVDVHADERHRGGCRDAVGERRLRLGVGDAAGVGGDADRGGRDVHQEWRRRCDSDRADVAGGGDGAS